MSISSQATTIPSTLVTNILYVHESQKGNPVINHLKNVKWQYTRDMKVDYLMNSTAALFLSVRYHHRHPKYIIRRIEEVGNMYRLRLLLVLVDDDQQLSLLQELNRLAFISNFTLIFTWSNLECARYLETFKNYENKSSQSIQTKEEQEFLPKLHKILSGQIKSINKTDVMTLIDVFQDIHHLFQAKEEELILCPGIGEKKAKRLFSVFHEPFLRQSVGNQPISIYEEALQGKNPSVQTISHSYEYEQQQEALIQSELEAEKLITSENRLKMSESINKSQSMEVNNPQVKIEMTDGPPSRKRKLEPETDVIEVE